jgi:hypothetical protein
MNWKTGLDYGWWKSTDFWTAVIVMACVLILAGIGSLLFGAWFLGWGS